MNKLYSLIIIPFLLTACYTQSGKVKVQSKVASYEAEKTLDDIKWYDGEPEGVQLIQISIPQNIINQYPELQDKLIVTRGRRGCEYKNKIYPTHEVPVKDVSGAGDTFMAGLVYEYVKSNNIEKAIRYAQECTTKVVQKTGVATP